MAWTSLFEDFFRSSISILGKKYFADTTSESSIVDAVDQISAFEAETDRISRYSSHSQSGLSCSTQLREQVKGPLNCSPCSRIFQARAPGPGPPGPGGSVAVCGAVLVEQGKEKFEDGFAMTSG